MRILWKQKAKHVTIYANTKDDNNDNDDNDNRGVRVQGQQYKMPVIPELLQPQDSCYENQKSLSKNMRSMQCCARTISDQWNLRWQDTC